MGNKLSKPDLVRGIAQRPECAGAFSQAEVSDVVDATFKFIAAQLAEGNTISVMQFGTFAPKHRAERTGHNIATKEVMTFPATTLPKFTAAAALKAEVAKHH